MSLWKSKRSIRCQLLPSKARTFQDWEQGGRNRHLVSVVAFFLKHTTYIHTLKTRWQTYTLTLSEHRLTRETWAQRQSVTTSRKEKILEDRQGWFRDPDPCCQKLPLYTRVHPQLSPTSASTHSTGVWVNQLILSSTLSNKDVFTQSRVLVRWTRNLLLRQKL